MAPPPVTLFDLLQFLPLLVCKVGSYLPVRFCKNLMNAVVGVAPDLPKLRGRLVDNWRNFRDLFGGQV